MKIAETRNIGHLSFAGERAAIGGYKPQYDDFARRVYDCIINQTLEEIRVADSEDVVGKLDDICYVTHTEVHAYQMKWTIVEACISYNNFKKLIPQIVDGWRKLTSLYGNKKVIPHLITNKKCSDTDRSIKDKKGTVIGTFDDYVVEVLYSLHKSEVVNDKWQDSLAELKETTRLNTEEWQQFWASFDFRHSYQCEDVDISNGVASQRASDILNLTRIIVQMAASPKHDVVATKNELLRKLGWDDRFITRFNHQLRIPFSEYEPLEGAIKLLNSKIREKTKGYIFLEGSPGSGKSTILSEWLNTIPNKCVRYHAFDFTSVASQKNNDHSRGEANTFLFDMVVMFEGAGLSNKTNTLNYNEYHYLRNRFYELLSVASQYYIESKAPFIVVIDGLDHITREYHSCTRTLMEVLPAPSDLPEGVVFILGSQSFRNIGLYKSIEVEYGKEENRIQMPFFVKEEVFRLAKKLLCNVRLNHDILDNIWIKSQGHPLYLRYIISRIKEECNANIIDDIAAYSGNIELYYDRLVQDCLKEDAKLTHFLGLLSRVIGDIKLDFVSEWGIDEQTKLDFNKKLIHLFHWDKNYRTISFFHNSFRQYLLTNTAIDILTGEYSRGKSFTFYRELASFIKKSKIESTWNLASYLYLGNKYDECLAVCSPEILIEQVRNFRPIWHIQRDINHAIEIATKAKDAYLLVRYLLLQSQIEQMRNQDYSALTLSEQFIELGYLELAKIQIRTDKQLHCSQEFALRLSRKCLQTSFEKEAAILFDLSYPEFLNHSPEEKRNHFNEIHNNMNLLKEWVHTAAYFMQYDDIKRHIIIFIEYLKAIATHLNERFDEKWCEESLIVQYVKAIVESEKWHEIDELLNNEETDLSIKYLCARDTVKNLIETKPEDSHISSYYSLLPSLFEQIPDKQKPYLQMAYISWEKNGDVNETSQYLNKVSWKDLGSYYLKEVRDEFKILRRHIKYVELALALGDKRSITDYVPEDTTDADNELMVSYMRKVLCLAQIKGRRNCISESQFLGLIEPYMESFDKIMPMHRNRFAYTISSQRADFYEYIVEVASIFGKHIVESVRLAAEHYFCSMTCKATPDAKRRMILAFNHHGIDNDICAEMLRHLQQSMLNHQDIDGRQSELYKHGKAMIALGFKDEAMELFRQMISASSGIGYRKDFQASTFAEWICDINKVEPDEAIERIHWLTSRLRFIAETSENNIAYEAAHTLLDGAFKYNLSTGIKLAQWLLDEEFEYFSSASHVVIKNLLQMSKDETDFEAIYMLYSQIHLLFDYDFEGDYGLLANLVETGKKIAVDSCGEYFANLRHVIQVYSSENIVPQMLEKLDSLLSSCPNEKEEKKNYHREADELLCKADECLKDGDKQKAWDFAFKSLEASSITGWARYYDGGTRINACKKLHEIDSERSKDLIFDVFAKDIPLCGAYGTMLYLNKIIPLIVNEVNQARLFNEEFAYMNRVLRSEHCNGNNWPQIEPQNCTVISIVKDWLLYLTSFQVTCLAEQAKMCLARMIDQSIISVCDIKKESLALEIGSYVLALDSEQLSQFADIATEFAVSDNYLQRLYSYEILIALSENIPLIPNKKLPIIYKLSLPTKQYPDFGVKNDFKNPFINWENPLSVISVASHITRYLSRITDVEEINLATRAVELMNRYGDRDEWSDDAEDNISEHYRNIRLHYPYRRKRAQAAIEAVMHVAVELLDSNVVHRYDNRIFNMWDYSIINLSPIPRPPFVQRIAPVGSWYIDKNWISQIEVCNRFKPSLELFEDKYVIGEVSSIIRCEDNIPHEEFCSILDCHTNPNTDSFFGDSAFGARTEDYYKVGDTDSQIIVQRTGYFHTFEYSFQWLAFNPAFAFAIGWIPDNSTMFAWNNADGERMVESKYWQSGNPNLKHRGNYEVGEGWLVLASKKALDQLISMGYNYVHQIDKSQYQTYNWDFPNQIHKVFALK